ncbi:MAG: Undecaprenyl-phosphate 4-deoxy-4-formamido-L-arabinose transferase [uncultured bacterium]|nr:MAG: Undecaprenyl-phosphate 4-deoxy-4-formamido-L-arabinose transferase [uncultured bacterium]
MNTINNNIQDDMLISLIIPINNEQENVTRLANEIENTMKTISLKWECIWVDDGSTDDSFKKIKEINSKLPDSHKFLQLKQNYGQWIAITAGCAFAKGNIYATIDGDCQNDPGDLINLIEKFIQHDADMVNGIRKKRNDSLIKKISSKIANGFRNWVTNENIIDMGCSLRVFKPHCLTNIKNYKGMHRFFPTIAKLNGYSKIYEYEVNHRPREKGISKYGIHNRLWSSIYDLIVVKWMQVRTCYPEIISFSSESTNEKSK